MHLRRQKLGQPPSNVHWLGYDALQIFDTRLRKLCVKYTALLSRDLWWQHKLYYQPWKEAILFQMLETRPGGIAVLVVAGFSKAGSLETSKYLAKDNRASMQT